ncbi:MAG: 2-C-methyl-D-erythritol 4-phosphate cytidylyltransferase [Deltaproteobacteria bacterium]|nr:2-C-methyl-D-erythritol 4-phosphate cytidylyltransferase [Deltaproteobacteria bacterium]MBW2010934.1 2-C-methyl-D-erythritol 4-phosphate cytidylyltransferase [Deltaproteobacteria bacterium]MBW2099870.1 2-C-methyl-D-erythritol 4-phosphate cytidylyltransferase [Deltaproteobacteria bacterium]
MVSAIIVAGGKGTRMKGSVCKQYLLLGDRPLLSHTLAAFDACRFIDKIFLVIPEEDFEFCRKNIIFPVAWQKKLTLVSGGIERQDSVNNGLLAVGDTVESSTDSIAVIHDGVRPFVRSDQIEACIDGARQFGACILGIPAFDTLKKVNDAGFIKETIKRDAVWLAQTPQAFQYSLIKTAHENAKQNGYSGTDDASLVEYLGKNVKVIAGGRCNIKITTREDLLLAKAILPSFTQN